MSLWLTGGQGEIQCGMRSFFNGIHFVHRRVKIRNELYFFLQLMPVYKKATTQNLFGYPIRPCRRQLTIEVQVLVTGNLVQFRISYQTWSLTSRSFTDGFNRISVQKNIKRISEGTSTKIFNSVYLLSASAILL